MVRSMQGMYKFDCTFERLRKVDDEDARFIQLKSKEKRDGEERGNDLWRGNGQTTLNFEGRQLI